MISDEANAEVVVIPEVETELALENIEEIVTTEGIEAAFLGPNDLSMSLGVFGQFNNSKFLKAVEKIVSACEAHDVSPGLLAPARPVETSLQQGFKMIQLGADLGFLTGSARGHCRTQGAISGRMPNARALSPQIPTNAFRVKLKVG
jgi:2-keto-3-deoxy-L-rhamnonate aldolase RhmA